MRPLVTRREADDAGLDRIAYLAAFPVVYFFAVEILATPVLGNAAGTVRFLALVAFSYLVVRLTLPRLKAEPRPPLLVGTIAVWLLYGVVVVVALGWFIATHWSALAGVDDLITTLVSWRPPLSDFTGWILFAPLVTAYVLTRYLVRAASNRQALWNAALVGGLGIAGPLVLFAVWILVRSHLGMPGWLGLLKFVEFKALAESLAAASAVGAGLAWGYVVIDQVRDVFHRPRGVPA